MKMTIIIIVLCFSFSANANLISNGGFERGTKSGNPVGWNAGKVITEDNDNHALVINSYGWTVRQEFTVQGSTRYLVSFRVKHQRGPSAARMSLILRDKSGERVSGGIGQLHSFTTDDWERFSGLFTTAKDASTATLYLLTYDKDGKSSFLVDNVRVVPIGKGSATTDSVFTVSDPLYKPLLSNQPPGLVSQGSMVWNHMTKAGLRDVAARMGRTYVKRRIFEQLAKYKMHTIGSPYLPLYKQTGVTAIYRPAHTTSKTVLSMLDPRAVQVFLDKTKRALEKYNGQIWGVFAGDEVTSRAMRQILAIRDNPEEAKSYDYFQTIKKQVKQKYGFGKYGLPTGKPGPKEKFRWIAFHRWVNDRIHTRDRKLKKLVEEVAPDVKLISTDPRSRRGPHEVSRIANVFDIFTRQLYPSKTPHRPTMGFYTKLLVDLTGSKEVWPCAHVENYAWHITPQQVRKLYSQVWRNGGTGFHLYIPDTDGATQKKGDTRLTRWGAPPRFRAIMDIVKRAMHQPRLKFPADAGCRILYPQYSFMLTDKPEALVQPLEASFDMLGPRVRSWFTFIDEYRLAHPLGNIAPKVIYLPYGPIIDNKTRQRLKEFVRNGGTLIVTDPQAFSYSINGDDTTSKRNQLVGAALGKSTSAQHVTFSHSALLEGINKKLSLRVLTTAYALKPNKGTKILGRYDNGKPAVTQYELGSGKIIYFGFNPFSYASTTMKSWQEFFKVLQRGMGFKTDLDIWRFTFPKPNNLYPPQPKGVCLTGNHVIWRLDKMVPHKNLKIGGTYSLSPAPDEAADTGGVKNIPFTKGDLTDRTNWPNLKKVKSKSYQPYDQPISDWVDTWSADNKDITITFNLKKSYPISRAKLWFSGSFKKVILKASNDKRHWTKVGENDGKDAGKDIMAVTVKAKDAQSYQYVKMLIERTTGKPLTIAEMEMWGNTK